jgi:flagellar basal body rod protein FlgB
MSDFAKNALMHNMAVEMLRKQYSMMEMALKERVD